MEGRLLLHLSFARSVTRAEKNQMLKKLMPWLRWDKYVYFLNGVKKSDIPRHQQELEKIAPHGCNALFVFIPQAEMADAKFFRF